MYDMIIDALQKLMQFLIDVVMWIPRHVFFKVTDTAADALNGLLESPCCTFIPDAASSLTNIFSTDIYFWMSYFNVGYGVGVIGCALMFRFLIRRLPFIG